MNVTKTELRNLLFSAATLSLIIESDECKKPLGEIYGFGSNDIRLRATLIWNAISKEAPSAIDNTFDGEEFLKTDLMGDLQKDCNFFDKESH